MEQLAFKYMDMCKVESSTDTDSEISPRWSDTSTMGCVSSAPESGTFHRTLKPLKPAARHGCSSLFLDPYDGSSEDSDESHFGVGVPRRTRQQGGGGGGGRRFLGRSRRFVLHHPASVALRDVTKDGTRDPVPAQQQPPVDIQMKCGTDSELWVYGLDTLPPHSDKDICEDLAAKMANDSTACDQTMDIELQLHDSGLLASRSSTPYTPGPLTPAGGGSSWMLDSSSERSPSPCDLRSLYKRKLDLPGAEVVEVGQRKRQCLINMKEEEAGDSASEPC